MRSCHHASRPSEPAQMKATLVSSSIDSDAALAVSLSMLLLTSVAFIWAGSDGRLAWWHDLMVNLLAASPDVAFFVLASYGVEARLPYLVCTALGLASTAWVFHRDRRK